MHACHCCNPCCPMHVRLHASPRSLLARSGAAEVLGKVLCSPRALLLCASSGKARTQARTCVAPPSPLPPCLPLLPRPPARPTSRVRRENPSQQLCCRVRLRHCLLLQPRPGGLQEALPGHQAESRGGLQLHARLHRPLGRGRGWPGWRHRPRSASRKGLHRQSHSEARALQGTVRAVCMAWWGPDSGLCACCGARLLQVYPASAEGADHHLQHHMTPNAKCRTVIQHCTLRTWHPLADTACSHGTRKDGTGLHAPWTLDPGQQRLLASPCAECQASATGDMGAAR